MFAIQVELCETVLGGKSMECEIAPGVRYHFGKIENLTEFQEVPENVQVH